MILAGFIKNKQPVFCCEESHGNESTWAEVCAHQRPSNQMTTPPRSLNSEKEAAPIVVAPHQQDCQDFRRKNLNLAMSCVFRIAEMETTPRKNHTAGLREEIPNKQNDRVSTTSIDLSYTFSCRSSCSRRDAKASAAIARCSCAKARVFQLFNVSLSGHHHLTELSLSPASDLLRGGFSSS